MKSTSAKINRHLVLAERELAALNKAEKTYYCLPETPNLRLALRSLATKAADDVFKHPIGLWPNNAAIVVTALKQHRTVFCDWQFKRKGPPMGIEGLPFSALELAEASALHSELRSFPYRSGLATRIDERVSQCQYKAAPYVPGTAEHEAYQAGREHGNRVIELLNSLQPGG